MKVAVISTAPTCGKSVFIEILASVYSRSQGRDACIFSTGNAKDNLELIDVYQDNKELNNPHVLRAMLNNSENDKTLQNYGVQSGDEHVFIFDILNAAMEQEDKEEFLLEAIDKIPADLTLIEICGDVESSINRRVMDICDCSLILMDTSLKGIRMLNETYAKLPAGAMRVNSAVVMSKLNPAVASDKKMSSLMKATQACLYKFPYNTTVAKLAIDGRLDKVAYNIIIGDNEVVGLRVTMLEIMQYLFDTQKRKVIREIAKWYK